MFRPLIHIRNLRFNIAIYVLAASLGASPVLADNLFYDLTINVVELKNNAGVVQFSLYNREGSLPDKYFERYYKMHTSRIDAGSASVTFHDLPAGSYAVNILHDENANGKIDTGFVLPVEGVGFSNYRTINLLNRPDFSKASFELNSHLSIFVNIIYM
ncbi:MAG: DUF2141 domain-containing protein [Gammaproteobacteria bacterium]|nr:DUF2141 domain-containing protein [Gammaproteobacteria bacterium]